MQLIALIDVSAGISTNDLRGTGSPWVS